MAAVSQSDPAISETPGVTVDYTAKSQDDIELELNGDNDITSLGDCASETPDAKQGKDEMDSNDKNPYAYLNRNEFTSEKFKIEVSGLPKYYGFSVRHTACSLAPSSVLY